MQRARFAPSLRCIFLLAICTVALLASCNRREGPERIVLIVVDTLRADMLRPYGGHVWTPAIQGLADTGKAYEAFGSFHQTTMSMSAMFTGRTPSLETGNARRPLLMTHRNDCGMARFRGTEDEKQCVPSSMRTLGELMSDAGYETIAVVSNSLLFRPFGIDQGFDDWTEVGKSRVRKNRKKRGFMTRVHQSRNGTNVNADLRDALARRKTNHFFLYVHYMEAHDYGGGKKLYRNAIGRADAMIADLLRHLDQEGLLEGTTFVFASDHGERLGEKHLLPGTYGHMGNPSFSEVLQVPLIVSPALEELEDAFIRTSDIFRILARLAGAPVDEDSALAEDELFLSEAEWQTYRRGKWKTFLRRKDGRHFLIDLERDAAETLDTSNDHPDIARRHRARIEQLANQLSARPTNERGLSEDDEERLRALGYVD